jgi:hypothetical protein
MTTHLSDTTLQIICLVAIAATFSVAFYAINSAINHLNHRVDELERALHKHFRKHK